MPKASTNCFYVGDLPGVQASASVSPTRARFSANPPKPRKSRAKNLLPRATTLDTPSGVLPSPPALPPRPLPPPPVPDLTPSLQPAFTMSEAVLQSPPHDPEGARQYAPTSGTPYRPANTYCSPITPLTTYDATLHGETPDNYNLSYSLYYTPAAATAPSSSTASSLPQAPRGFVDETIDCRPIPRMRRVKRSAEDKLKDVLDVLSDNDIPLITVILAILRPATPTYETYRNRFFNLDNINRLPSKLLSSARASPAMGNAPFPL